MKTHHIFFVALCLIASACKPLYIEPLDKLKGDFGTPNMEFIGFVNTPGEEYAPMIFSGFGRELERCKIAVNSQTYSLGTQFDMHELDSFPALMRYVSYVKIDKLDVTYEQVLNYCLQQIVFKADVCIYDTEKKKMVKTLPISIKYQQAYKGYLKKSNPRMLEHSERVILTNTVLNYYAQAYRYVDDIISGKQNVK